MLGWVSVVFFASSFAISDVRATAPNTTAASSSSFCYVNFASTQFANCLQLSSQVALHWTVYTRNHSITFGIDTLLPTTVPWFGFGISSTGAMRGADIYLLQRNSSGDYTLQDMFSTDYEAPILDKVSQDVELLTTQSTTSNVMGTYMRFSFSRPLASLDPEDISIAKGVTNYLIWAYGNPGETTFSPHSPFNQGSLTTILYKDPAVMDPPLPAAVHQMAIQMPNVTLGADVNQAKCMYFDFPTDKKYHVMAHEAVAVSEFTHSMVLYLCESFSNPGASFDCSNKIPTGCQAAASWAKGSSDRNYFPKEAGLAIGSGYGSARHGLLQAIYTNPTQTQSTVDQSGLSIWYSDQLRPFDIGTATLGTFQVNIPGNYPNYTTTTNLCSSSCSGKLQYNMTVFGVRSLMRGLGSSMSVRRFRGDTELDPILKLDYFDSMQQREFQPGNRMTPYQTSMVVLPGDSFVTSCTWKPTLGISDSDVRFGFEDKQEMCHAFMMYYPRQDFGFCIDFPAKPICQSNPIPMENLQLLDAMTDLSHMFGYVATFALISTMIIHPILSLLSLMLIKFGFQKPQKLAFQIFYVPLELAGCFIMGFTFTVPVLSSLKQNLPFVAFKYFQGDAVAIMALFFSASYVVESLSVRDMPMMLRMHHTVQIITLTMAYSSSFAFQGDPALVMLIVVLTTWCMWHLPIDFLPHLYLVIRRFVERTNEIMDKKRGSKSFVIIHKGLKMLRDVLGFLCIWPLTLLRLVIHGAFGLVAKYLYDNSDKDARTIVFFAVIILCDLLLFVTQMWAHTVYVAIVVKDRKGEREARKQLNGKTGDANASNSTLNEDSSKSGLDRSATEELGEPGRYTSVDVDEVKNAP